MSNEMGKAYIEWCRFRLMSHYWPRVEKCLASLSEEEVWWRQHETNNSVGNLVLHLTGNLRQFILAGIGRAPDTRDKPREFAERKQIPKEQLLRDLHLALEQTDSTLADLDTNRFLDTTIVQGKQRTLLEVIAVVEDHFALHVGQIIFITLKYVSATTGATGTPVQGAARSATPNCIGPVVMLFWPWRAGG
jgi:hypothetical protein